MSRAAHNVAEVIEVTGSHRTDRRPRVNVARAAGHAIGLTFTAIAFAVIAFSVVHRSHAGSPDPIACCADPVAGR